MNTHERVQAIAEYGFTERQAGFLVLVMRHSGLCVKRQYASFAGIKPGGEKCNAFFTKLVQRGYAVTADCIHNRAQLFHVHHKPLYHAIGDPESRYRRAVPAARAKERLMRLDVGLISPDLDWLTTRAEKLAYLAARTAQTAADAAQAISPQDPPLLPGTFPIGLDPAGDAVLLYVATVPWTDDLRSFLVGHLALLAVIPRWTLRIVFPPALNRYVPDHERAVYEELEKRLDPAALNELRWYFFHSISKSYRIPTTISLPWSPVAAHAAGAIWLTPKRGPEVRASLTPLLTRVLNSLRNAIDSLVSRIAFDCGVDGNVRSAEGLVVIRCDSKRGGVLCRPVRARWGLLSTGTKA